MAETVLDPVASCLEAYEDSPEVASRFEACNSDVQRFVVAEQHVNETVSFSSDSPPHAAKNIDETKGFVTKGLGQLAAKKYADALASFNQAVRFAPWRVRNTPQEDVHLTVAAVLGHRAMTHFHLKGFNYCIVDIEQAISLECPRAMKGQLLLKKAEALLALRHTPEALHTLVEEAKALRLFHEKPRSGQQPDQERKKYNSLLARAQFLKQNSFRRRGSTVDPLPLVSEPCFEEEKKKFLLKGGRSKNFPSASSAVKLKYDEENGRHLVARKNLSIGDVVVVESPFVSFSNQKLCSNCYTCFKFAHSPFPCKTCFLVVFCSSTCAGMPQGVLHARECNLWRSLLTVNGQPYTEDPLPGCSRMAMTMAMRTVLLKTHEEWRQFFSSVENYANCENDGLPTIPKATYLSDDHENVFWLAKNTKQYQSKFIFELACLAVFTLRILEEGYFRGGEKLDPDLRNNLGGLLLHHAINFTTNWTGVGEWSPLGFKDAEKTCVAAAIYPTLALCNFSCSPNLVAVHLGDVVVLRALRPICRGETLTVNRIGTYDQLPIEERQSQARAMGFECKCVPCVMKWPLEATLKKNHDSCIYPLKCPYCSNISRVSLDYAKEATPVTPLALQGSPTAIVSTKYQAPVLSEGFCPCCANKTKVPLIHTHAPPPRLKCPYCGKELSSWVGALNSVAEELFPKKGQSGVKNSMNTVASLLPTITHVYGLCREPCYAMIHCERLVRNWFTAPWAGLFKNLL